MIQTLDQITLTDEQSAVLAEVLDAYQPGSWYLLTGPAGTGKTTVVQKLIAEWLDMGLSMAATAPTHKAVSVIASKLKASGINADCMTLHSLLSLRPKVVKDRQVFKRYPLAPPVLANVVIIDECSMLGADIMMHIRRHLPNAFVLFVGDPAQIPPVGEVASQSFGIRRASHLRTIVRQAADNPVIGAAAIIRASQETGAADWSWCRPAKHNDMGVYLPGNDVDRWMQRGFVSNEFAGDPDHCRFLCWTNDRVREINRRVRRWLYEDRTKPFSPGERALFRAPLVREGEIIVATNEEPTVTAIEEDVFVHRFEKIDSLLGWTAEIPAWRMEIKKAHGCELVVYAPRDRNAVDEAIAKATDEARDFPEHWDHRQAFKTAMAEVQSIYAMTVHVSQGSTFRNAFVDVRNIRQRERSNLLEMQQLLYTAATRPSHALVLAGAPVEAA
jgi:exodeoxyribonuclease V